jgi:hypothetical protein
MIRRLFCLDVFGISFLRHPFWLKWKESEDCCRPKCPMHEQLNRPHDEIWQSRRLPALSNHAVRLAEQEKASEYQHIHRGERRPKSA